MERNLKTIHLKWVCLLSSFYHLDGSYFPRLYFINPDGSVNYDIVSDPSAERYQFYYPDPQHIIDAMKRMIKDLKAKKQRRLARQAAKEVKEVDDSQFMEEDL